MSTSGRHTSLVRISFSDDANRAQNSSTHSCKHRLNEIASNNTVVQDILGTLPK